MASLSTHVLDTSRGRPAAGITIELHFLKDGVRQLLTTVVTNDDGRPREALSRGSLVCGTYELTFHAAAYFRALSVEMSSPPFLDEIVIRFGIGDAAAHYHVPLLLSPYGYSTYRGS
jgi:5-hydroxyisourate hydrolase